MSDDTVHVGVTIIPQAKLGHFQAFTTEEAADAYVEASEKMAEDHENIPEGALVWIGSAEVEVEEEYDAD